MIRFAFWKGSPGSSVGNRFGDGKAEAGRSFGDHCSHLVKKWEWWPAVGEITCVGLGGKEGDEMEEELADLGTN